MKFIIKLSLIQAFVFLAEGSTNHEAREDMLKFMNEISYTMVARTQHFNF